VRYAEVARTRVLERRLTTQERENEHALTKLYRQLTVARSDLRRLRRRMRRSEDQNRQLRRDLVSARSSAAQLEDHVSSLSDTLRETPPFVAVRLEANHAGSRLVAVAENRGRNALQIVESRGFLWLGDAPGEVPGSLGPLDIPPDTGVDVFEFALPSPIPDLAAAPLAGFLCLAYQSLGAGGGRTWVEEQRFEYRPASGSVALLDHESATIPGDIASCQMSVAALMP
jgi:hypothetical protein